ncbi:MAG: hypothetical protein ACRC6R_02590 [Bacteroidales bacterium]
MKPTNSQYRDSRGFFFVPIRSESLSKQYIKQKHQEKLNSDAVNLLPTTTASTLLNHPKSICKKLVVRISLNRTRQLCTFADKPSDNNLIPIHHSVNTFID